MRGFLIFRRAAAVAAVLLVLETTLVRAANEPLHAPDIVMDQLDRLEPIDRVEDLPAPIREGKFGEAVDEWALAEPGGHWNATDLIMDKSPQRRLVIAGCSPNVCVVNYERGGRAYHLVLAAFVRKRAGWSLDWFAVGWEPLRTLDELRALLGNRSALKYADEMYGGRPIEKLNL